MLKKIPNLPVLYFDGACPVCAREITHYRKQAGSENFAWVDASSCPLEVLGPDLSRADALARLHLRHPDGSLVSGAEAFVGVWQGLKAWAWLARLFNSRPAVMALDVAYRLFLRIRPLWRSQAKHGPQREAP